MSLTLFLKNNRSEILPYPILGMNKEKKWQNRTIIPKKSVARDVEAATIYRIDAAATAGRTLCAATFWTDQIGPSQWLASALLRAQHDASAQERHIFHQQDAVPDHPTKQ
jgi:hypothetical protein